MSHISKAFAKVNGNAPGWPFDPRKPKPAPPPLPPPAQLGTPRQFIAAAMQGPEAPPVILAERPGAGSASLEDIFARLARRKFSILAATLAGASAALLISAAWTPVYRARAAIRLEEVSERVANSTEVVPPVTVAPNEMYLQNELKILQSDELAKRIGAELGMAAPPPSGFGPFSNGPLANFLARFSRPTRQPSLDDIRIRAVHRALAVLPSLKSAVFEIYFEAADPALAARGANAAVSQYVALGREARKETTKNTDTWLTTQIAELKTKLDSGNERLQALARSGRLQYNGDQRLLSQESARQLREQLAKARTDRAAKQTRYETAASGSPDALPADSDTALLRDYEAKLSAVQAELTQLKAIYTGEHYKVKDAEARAAQLEASIKAERGRALARMRGEYENANRFEKTLSSSYESQSATSHGESGDAVRYRALKRELDSTEELYNSLVQKAREAEIAFSRNVANVRVIDMARPPDSPVSPNIPLNVAAGFFGALILAMGTVLVRDRDSYIAKANLDAYAADVRELGMIPSAKARPAALVPGVRAIPASSVELVAWQEPPSMVTEAFRATLTSILFSPGCQRQHGVLAVTSAQPREGKTTTICNLGIALVETHGRVLLVDADLRRPRLHEIFDRDNDEGLTTVLASQEPVASMNFGEIIRESNIPGLFTLPSGPGTDSIASLLYSPRMKEFLDRARKEFDFVLIDTPPAGLFTDARILGRHADAVILVIHSEKTGRAELNSICSNFAKDGTNVLGTVVNHWNGGARDARSYGGYYNQPSA